MSSPVPAGQFRRADDRPKRSRRMRRGIYLLPSLFTSLNMALGYYALYHAIQGSAAEPWHYDNAAKAIGFAIIFDGLDGRIARMTNTTSDFGREFDSLADVITFGIAPAMLAWLWGFRLLSPLNGSDLIARVAQMGAIATFAFLIAGASRLARFNIQTNPQPSNPGRPGRKYFVGMPIPAGAGVIAAIVHFTDGSPIVSWWMGLIWAALVFATGYLMISTWRFYSFKDLDFRSRHPFWVVVVIGVIIACIRYFSEYFLFFLALFYMLSGVFARLLYILRRRGSPPPPPLEAHPSPMNRQAKPAGAEGHYRVAIVGAGTLKGKELAEVLPETSFPAADIKLLDDDESLGQLETVGEEVTFVQSVRQENFEHVNFTFFASQPDFTRKHWRLAQQAGSMIVDLSYGLEEAPGTRVRSPWLERELRQAQIPELEPAPVVAAHPAAIVLALLIARAQQAAGVRSAVATILEPASERGRAGMDELHEQTVNLLSFQEMPKQVFDAQVAFNLLARYGEHSSFTLETAERRVLAHIRQIAPGLAVPSLMLVQAPIFHGHAFSLYIEMEQPLSLGDFSQAVGGEHVALTRGTEESPSNVSAAGQEDVMVWVRADAQRETGFWIWAAADNLRVMALNAIECAQQMAAAMPKGKLQ